MRPVRRRTRADPLSLSFQAHAIAEDQRREAERSLGLLIERLHRFEEAAAERGRRGEEALRRGDDLQGLALLDGAAGARAAASELRGRRGAMERQLRQLASVERLRRAELFRQLAGLMAEMEPAR
jgi:hypothetical protein